MPGDPHATVSSAERKTPTSDPKVTPFRDAMRHFCTRRCDAKMPTDGLPFPHFPGIHLGEEYVDWTRTARRDVLARRFPMR